MPSTNDSTRSGSRSSPARSWAMVCDHDVLHQVGGGVGVAQVAQAVAPDPRREQPVELGLGVAGLARRRGGDAPGDPPFRRLGGGGVDGFHGAKHSQATAKRNP